MTSFWILITGIFYIFISIFLKLKKIYSIIYLVFGIVLIIASTFKELYDLKFYIIFFLYFPLVLLAIKKETIFKQDDT